MISTRTHGVLDYLSAAALIAVPQLFGWRSGLSRPLMAASLGTAAYSLLTRYEWGVVGALSMREHLALDALQGAAFCTAAALLNREPPEVRSALAGYGLFAIAAAALTDQEPEATRSPPHDTMSGW
jgi:hypothetical protein